MTPETCNSPDKTRSEPGTEEAQAVNVALRKLRNEVAGLKAFEPFIRETVGNTNWNVLMLRLEEADAALAAPALPQDVAAQIKWLRKEADAEAFRSVASFIRGIADTLTIQSSTIASAREVIEQLLPAAEKVLEGLHARIDAAEKTAVPVFYGISDLHDAIGAARDWKGR